MPLQRLHAFATKSLRIDCLFVTSGYWDCINLFAIGRHSFPVRVQSGRSPPRSSLAERSCGGGDLKDLLAARNAKTDAKNDDEVESDDEGG